MGDDKKRDTGTELYLLLADHNSDYSVDDRLKVVMMYNAEGNLTEIARKTGIPYYTIKDWKRKTDWWPLAVQECKKHKQEELDRILTKVIHKTIVEMSDRIDNGDYSVKKMEP